MSGRDRHALAFLMEKSQDNLGTVSYAMEDIGYHVEDGEDVDLGEHPKGFTAEKAAAIVKLLEEARDRVYTAIELYGYKGY